MMTEKLFKWGRHNSGSVRMGLFGFFCAIGVAASPAAARELPAFELTEGWLVEQGSNQGYRTLQIDLQRRQATLNQLENDAAYGMSWDSQVAWSQTSESAGTGGEPVRTPGRVYSTGLKQRLQHGLSLSGSLFTESAGLKSQQPGTPASVGRSGARVQAQLDLGANRLGRVDALRDQLFRSQSAGTQTRSKWEAYQQVQQLRSVYWGMVANRQNRQWRMQILESARRQANIVRKQKANYVADAEDVARFSALAATQEATLVGLDREYAQLEETLKDWVPALRGKRVIVRVPDLIRTRQQVMQCVQSIRQTSAVPFGNSTASQYLQQLDKTTETARNLDGLSDHYQLMLGGSLEYSGTEENSQKAFTELSENRKHKAEISLNLSIPLGKTRSNLREEQVRLRTLGRDLEHNRIRAQMISSFESIQKQSELLMEALEAQGRISSIQSRKLKLAREKFSQARIPLAILIEDETALLASRIGTTNLELQVARTVLDYLSLFDQTDCAFNRS